MSCFVGQMKEYERISLDRFDKKNLRSTVYFLSHLHEDHTEGLAAPMFHKRLKSNKTIYLYCSEVTKILLEASQKYCHLSPFVKTIAINTPTTIEIPDPLYDEKEMVTVTMLPAFHCPGSVMCLFEGSEGTVLYTGDFRWEHFDLEQMHHLRSGESVKKIKSLYIDTTFCVEENLFIPSRQQCIDAVYHLVNEWTSQSPQHVVYFFLRAQYGHEPLLNAVASRLKKPVHVSGHKAEVYDSIAELHGNFTADGTSTQIHACPNNALVTVDEGQVQCRQAHDEDKVLIILPTTMYFTHYQHLTLDKVIRRINANFYRACYSFHSSYTEVKDLLAYLKPDNVYPNVKPPSDSTLHVTQQRLTAMLAECCKGEPEEDSLSNLHTEVQQLGTLKTRRGQTKLKRKDSGGDTESLDFGTPAKMPRKETSLSQGSNESGKKRGKVSASMSQPAVTRRSSRRAAQSPATGLAESGQEAIKVTPQKRSRERSVTPDLFLTPSKSDVSEVTERQSSYAGSYGDESEIDLTVCSQRSLDSSGGEVKFLEQTIWSGGSFLAAVQSSSLEDEDCVIVDEDGQQTQDVDELLQLVTMEDDAGENSKGKQDEVDGSFETPTTKRKQRQTRNQKQVSKVGEVVEEVTTGRRRSGRARKSTSEIKPGTSTSPINIVEHTSSEEIQETDNTGPSLDENSGKAELDTNAMSKKKGRVIKNSNRNVSASKDSKSETKTETGRKKKIAEEMKEDVTETSEDKAVVDTNEITDLKTRKKKITVDVKEGVKENSEEVAVIDIDDVKDLKTRRKKINVELKEDVKENSEEIAVIDTDEVEDLQTRKVIVEVKEDVKETSDEIAMVDVDEVKNLKTRKMKITADVKEDIRETSEEKAVDDIDEVKDLKTSKSPVIGLVESEVIEIIDITDDDSDDSDNQSTEESSERFEGIQTEMIEEMELKNSANESASGDTKGGNRGISASDTLHNEVKKHRRGPLFVEEAKLKAKSKQVEFKMTVEENPKQPIRDQNNKNNQSKATMKEDLSKEDVEEVADESSYEAKHEITRSRVERQKKPIFVKDLKLESEKETSKVERESMDEQEASTSKDAVVDVQPDSPASVATKEEYEDEDLIVVDAFERDSLYSDDSFDDREEIHIDLTKKEVIELDDCSEASKMERTKSSGLKRTIKFNMKGTESKGEKSQGKCVIEVEKPKTEVKRLRFSRSNSFDMLDTNEDHSEFGFCKPVLSTSEAPSLEIYQTKWAFCFEKDTKDDDKMDLQTTGKGEKEVTASLLLNQNETRDVEKEKTIENSNMDTDVTMLEKLKTSEQLSKENETPVSQTETKDEECKGRIDTTNSDNSSNKNSQKKPSGEELEPCDATEKASISIDNLVSESVQLSEQASVVNKGSDNNEEVNVHIDSSKSLEPKRHNEELPYPGNTDKLSLEVENKNENVKKSNEKTSNHDEIKQVYTAVIAEVSSVSEGTSDGPSANEIINIEESDGSQEWLSCEKAASKQAKKSVVIESELDETAGDLCKDENTKAEIQEESVIIDLNSQNSLEKDSLIQDDSKTKEQTPNISEDLLDKSEGSLGENRVIDDEPKNPGLSDEKANKVDENSSAKAKPFTFDETSMDLFDDIPMTAVSLTIPNSLSEQEKEAMNEVKRQAMGFVCDTDSDSDSEDSTPPHSPTGSILYDDYIELSSGSDVETVKPAKESESVKTTKDTDDVEQEDKTDTNSKPGENASDSTAASGWLCARKPAGSTRGSDKDEDKDDQVRVRKRRRQQHRRSVTPPMKRRGRYTAPSPSSHEDSSSDSHRSPKRYSQDKFRRTNRPHQIEDERLSKQRRKRNYRRRFASPEKVEGEPNPVGSIPVMNTTFMKKNPPPVHNASNPLQTMYPPLSKGKSIYPVPPVQASSATTPVPYRPPTPIQSPIAYPPLYRPSSVPPWLNQYKGTTPPAPYSAVPPPGMPPFVSMPTQVNTAVPPPALPSTMSVPPPAVPMPVPPPKPVPPPAVNVRSTVVSQSGIGAIKQKPKHSTFVANSSKKGKTLSSTTSASSTPAYKPWSTFVPSEASKFATKSPNPVQTNLNFSKLKASIQAVTGLTISESSATVTQTAPVKAEQQEFSKLVNQLEEVKSLLEEATVVQASLKVISEQETKAKQEKSEREREEEREDRELYEARRKRFMEEKRHHGYTDIEREWDLYYRDQREREQWYEPRYGDPHYEDFRHRRDAYREREDPWHGPARRPIHDDYYERYDEPSPHHRHPRYEEDYYRPPRGPRYERDEYPPPHRYDDAPPTRYDYDYPPPPRYDDEYHHRRRIVEEDEYHHHRPQRYDDEFTPSHPRYDDDYPHQRYDETSPQPPSHSPRSGSFSQPRGKPIRGGPGHSQHKPGLVTAKPISGAIPKPLVPPIALPRPHCKAFHVKDYTPVGKKPVVTRVLSRSGKIVSVTSGQSSTTTSQPSTSRTVGSNDAKPAFLTGLTSSYDWNKS